MEILKSMIDPKIVMAIVISFIVASILGPIIIPLLHKLKFGQNIRQEGPKSHLKKAGTPTIGGLIFIFATIITMFIMVGNPTDEAMIALYSFVGFGFVGFLDDLLKIIKKKNEGLTSGQKMILLLIVSGFLTWYAYKYIGTSINIPFLNGQINLGLFYIPAAMFYFAGVTNAVNLTDGLDGLATSVTVLVTTFLGIISYNLGHISLAIFCVALAGALLAFLRFNAFPARVFMGDTGSLALGGAVAMVALILKMPLILVLIGIIYVIETLSVILQVASFKLTGKRIFKMAPIHHHFEQLGWSETKIVSVFSIITVVFCFIAFASL
ncbi:TPA: phospho-N-acetylmuramoyl-pentapeptide-transferase [Clostridium perfringens]|mgnify:FL=1|uniref:phospho-N-acetylmuramoyl-pentapeptide- transferase n=1 Tax=Clostridium perfringens TaxID=1502 RepID=UPI000F5492F2|nr:phospho-N-acetylmuramoyl-pentapeptide-transferase [Clostridium perfringens]EGT0013150.1 phospho-N-acetylmuramoyl-pentapeptide-transferase [Clostridium perfringens]EGT4143530.1 phospho-N-acetylmuramoyl-pentapeptide-transferase [Clostridium perfringens]EHK2440385.1 phospho-N-acetylmuramoyl-pentapeptide-transferase [Clostridium perfringens]EIW6612919.1 phospho-N-acetylmuramoyl-pentapeptide-transferase [Clostridium perfringens]EJT6339942.1 phospho-N-acetylmuramoyl-pentapeptide-transferase [Clos